MARSCRRLVVAIPLCSCVLVTGIVAWLLWPRTAITRDNVAKIQAGMTLVEVEAILGGPPRNESSGPLIADLDVVVRDAKPGAEKESMLAAQADLLFFITEVQPEDSSMWRSDQVILWVRFDHTARVRDCTSLPVKRAPESPLAAVRRWLGF